MEYTQKNKPSKEEQHKHRFETVKRYIKTGLSREQFSRAEGMSASTFHNWCVRPEIRAALGAELDSRKKTSPVPRSPKQQNLVEVVVPQASSTPSLSLNTSVTLVAVKFGSEPTSAQLKKFIGALAEC